MDITTGRAFIAQDVKFDEAILYHQLLSQPTKLMLEPASELPSGEPAPPGEPPQQLLKAKPRPINPIDDSDDDLSPPPDSPESDRMLKELESDLKMTAPATSSRTLSGRSTIIMAMMIEPGPKTYCAALNSENADQWKEAIGKEVSSMESHGVFTFVERPPGDVSMIESRWVMGRKHLANGQTEKWKVRQVGRGDEQKPGDYNDITSPVIDSASGRLALGIAAKHDLEIAVHDIPTAFLGCPMQETLYMRLPDGEWPDDPSSQARPIVKLNKTLYGIKQANRAYFEEVFEFIVDDQGLQASLAAPRHFFGGTHGKHNGVLIPMYVDDIMIIGSLELISSIASRLYNRFKAAGHVPVPDTFQYLGMTVTRNYSKWSIAIDHIGYINRQLDRIEMASVPNRQG